LINKAKFRLILTCPIYIKTSRLKKHLGNFVVAITAIRECILIVHYYLEGAPRMLNFVKFLVVSSILLAQTASAAITWTKVSDGVLFSMSPGNMKVQVCSDKVIRVVYTMKSTIPRADSNYIVVKGTWDPADFSVTESASSVSIVTATVTADVSKTTGAVSFSVGGTMILQETAAKTLTATTIGAYTAYAGNIKFNSTSDEGIYGFGQFQNGLFNQRGLSLVLEQKNQTDCSPVFLSTRGFGVLWINYSKMTVAAPLTLTCDWATNDAIDYYFMYGPEFDQIISTYRTITGPAPLWPKWAYGYWQCKNRYSYQSDILSVVDSFRSKNYPIDNIVQDWQYYPDGMNGSGTFDHTRYPNPAGMIDSLHKKNCHFTISVWPSYAANTDNKNWVFMNSRGYLLNTSDYLGQTYDPFNDSAAFYYWKFIEDSLVTKGVDAFWPDATEPESYAGVGWPNCVTAQGPSAKVLNIFPLLHSKNLHDGFRRATAGKKRVCNLTRSYYAGAQRLGAAYWTGDVDIVLNTYLNQLPAGLNVCATGLPYFCTDVGGFLGETDPNILARWFQWGAFNPVFRIHGSRNTELYLAPQKTVETILVKYSRLRYRLFPYVYACAWKVTNEGYTIMRGLPFDFRNDPAVRDRTDEFMFGPSFLVCPVTSTSATTRSVYLPAGSWYDFWTGSAVAGAQTVTAQTPLETMPLYIRAGAIVPMGPQATYATPTSDPIELRVYTGADGSFTLYEDEGDNYNYEQGSYATIPITWDNTNQVLTIGSTSGSFPGMLTSRKFDVVWVAQGHGTGVEVTAFDKEITYTGSQLSLDKKTGEIGVLPHSKVLPGISYSATVRGRQYFFTSRGNAAWKVRVTTLSGRVLAEKKVTGTASCMVADHLATGAYIADIACGTELTWKKLFIVP
jgi:alpha-D-xyloside xylohydrolase